MRFHLLTEADVRAVLSMGDLIEAMAAALRRFSGGVVVQPVRSVIAVGTEQAFFGTMPAYVREPATLGAKLVTVFNSNTARGLPTHLASIVLLDPETGALRAILDGRYITEARTAAVSAVSSRLLARPDAATLAIIGSGVQARSHFEALAHVHALRAVRVWSPNAERREDFVAWASENGPPGVETTATTRAEDAVAGADVIVLATASPTPVIEDAWVKAGAHVICIGACRPTQREMDPALVTRARLFVDSRTAALVESGDVVMAIAEGRFGADHIVAEVGQVAEPARDGAAAVSGVTGALGVTGRRSDSEVTVFKSLGLAVEDVTAADLAWRRAVERGVGRELTL